MLNEKEIYTHLINGGKEEDLFNALENEINLAYEKIKKEEEKKKALKEKEEKRNEALERAVSALLEYFNFVKVKTDEKSLRELLLSLSNFDFDIKQLNSCIGLIKYL